MATLNADIPDELYAKLEKLALAHNISINTQIILLLEKALLIEVELDERRKMVPKLLEESRRRREQLPTDIEWPDSTAMIREDRDR
ncbi:hypothetical protein [Iningainema tapete]|uniref:Arc-like DNA binding domain-containing protein n=1 Tax=Iningainema tapete BLCC-T55 TaxID=2748662 RepID=A0A8J7CAX4_9CYAN|nr:hypothetical protein [Iningainema tapete]MBD2777661.1 hypothetical protein [Iningainema tapete BLCC-T55]